MFLFVFFLPGVCLPSGFLICGAKAIGNLLHHALVLDVTTSLLVDEIRGCSDGKISNLRKLLRQ
jgi:hypothetical protein